MKNHFVGGDYGTRMASMKVSELNVDNDEKKYLLFVIHLLEKIYISN